MTPVTWYRVNGLLLEPEPRQFLRETPKFLVPGRGPNVMKETAYDKWYSTLAEAQEAADAVRAEASARAELRRVEKAAPMLLAALRGALGALERDMGQAECSRQLDWWKDADQRLEAARAAIKEAEG